jgi:hypothetical protein
MVGDSASKSSSKRNLYIAIIAAVVIVSIVAVIRYSDVFAPPSPYPGVGKPGSEHVHASFMVYIEGGAVDFSPKKSPHYSKANEYIFLENDARTIHRFATNATLGMFFESLGMKFNSTCFILPEPLNGKTDYCESDDKTMKFYVNNELNVEYEKYVIKERDRILISYGNENERAIDAQLGSIRGLPFGGFQ